MVGCELPSLVPSRRDCPSRLMSRDFAFRAVSAPRRRHFAKCVNLAPGAPTLHHLCNVRPRFRQGLALSRGAVSPVHVLTHTFSCARSFTCCAWCAGLTSTTPLPCAARGGRLLQFFASTPPSQCGCGCDGALSVPLRPPGSTPAEAQVVATLRSCRRCAWPRASWSVGSTLALIDRSACLVEPLSLIEPFCCFPCLCRPHKARPAPRPIAARQCPSRGLVEGLVLPKYSFRAALLFSVASLQLLQALPSLRGAHHHTLLMGLGLITLQPLVLSHHVHFQLAGVDHIQYTLS